MPRQVLLELEIAACDMNFCLSGAESSPGICKDQNYFFTSCLMQRFSPFAKKDWEGTLDA